MNIKACTSKPQIGRDEKTTLRVREGLEMWHLRYTWRVLDACQRIRMTQKMRVLFWCWQLPSSVIAQCGSIYFVWPSVERFSGLGPLRCDSLHGGLALSPGGSPSCCSGDWKVFILDRTNTDSRAGVLTCWPKEQFFISFHKSWASAWGHPGQPTHKQAGRS